MASHSMSTTSNAYSLHIFFFPYLARGHTLPCVATARLFAQRGVRCTVITTPGNSSYIQDTIEEANRSGLSLHLLLIPFPSAEVGLPGSIECTDVLPLDVHHESRRKFSEAVCLLRQPFRDLVVQHRPDCIISDNRVPWPADLAIEFSIPHVVFIVYSPFSLSVFGNLMITGAYLAHPESDSVGPLVGLPHPVVFDRKELLYGPHWQKVFEEMQETEKKSVGILFNSFDELAPEYVEYFGKLARPGSTAKTWCVGPVQLMASINNKTVAGGNWEFIKNWLDSKNPESVIYISFGSEFSFPAEQLREIAAGLESCRGSFIWVVRGAEGKEIEEEFGPRVGNRGLILTEWVPQVAILNHRAVGGFVTHCGWNAILEAVCAGLPVVAWPAQWEQFINERLVVEVLGIGVRILDGPTMRRVEAGERKEIAKRDTIRAAVDRLLMGGGDDEEVMAIRKKAGRYGELARMAMAKGGSSYHKLSSVIEEINTHSERKNKTPFENT